MKRITSLLLVFASMLLLTNCKKDDDNPDFYNLTTYTETNNGDVYLYINDQNRGKLPYVASGVADCGDAKALNLSLSPGTYSVSLKDEAGSLKSVLTVQLSEDATVTGSNYTLVQADKCILLSIDY